MLVLISFGLVLVATVLLVLGLLADSGLTLIYLSIACSVVAGVLLIAATRVGRTSGVPLAAAGSAGTEAVLAPTHDVRPVASTTAPAAPVAAAGADPAPPVAERVEMSTPVQPTPPRTVDESAFAPEPNPATAATGVVPAPVEPVDEDEEFFPIADYDDLSVSQIMPLLPELYADEVEVVDGRERSGASRSEILERLAELRELLRDAPPDSTGASVAAATAATGTVAPLPAFEAKDDAAPALAETAPATRVESMPEDLPTAASSPPPAPAAKKAAVKKTVVKKAAVKKAVVKKAAVKKAVVKKAAVKKAVVKKAATKKAAAVKSATTKKAAAVKSATTKKAAAVEKASAKKAPAKKVPAKKATVKKASAPRKGAGPV